MSRIFKSDVGFSDTTLPLITDSGRHELIDSYGTMLYRLSAPFIGDGIDDYIDTGIQLYKAETNWTLVAKFSDTMTCSAGYPAVIFSCANDTLGKGLRIRKTSDNPWFDITAGSGAFPSTAGGLSDDVSGDSILIIRKTGDNYAIYRNGVLAYGGELGYGIGDTYFNARLLVGAQFNGLTPGNFTACEIDLLKIYNAALSNDAIAAIYAGIVTGTYS